MNFYCLQCGNLLLLRKLFPLAFYCAQCEREQVFALKAVANTTALTIQGNEHTWGEVTRTPVPDAFYTAFEHKEEKEGSEPW